MLPSIPGPRQGGGSPRCPAGIRCTIRHRPEAVTLLCRAW